MRVRVFITWFLVLNLSVQTVLRGATPVPDQTAAQDVAKPPSTVPGSVEKFFEFRKFLDLSDDPDWYLVIAGIIIAFFGTQRLLGDLGNILTSDLPSYLKFSRLSSLLKVGEKVQSQLEQMAEDLKPLGIEARKTAEALQKHIDFAPKRLPLAGELRNKKPSEVLSKLAEPGVESAISQKASGRVWLATFHRLMAANEQKKMALSSRFVAGATELRVFSNQTNLQALGFLRTADLAHRPLHYDAFPMKDGSAGSINLRMDGGFNIDVADPGSLWLQAHGPRTKCADLLAQVNAGREGNLVKLRLDGFAKPALHTGVLALGGLFYWWGGRLIKLRTHSYPAVLIEKAKVQAQVDSYREMFRSGDLNNLTDQLREARRLGKDPDIQEVYRVFREALRTQLPELAESVRNKSKNIAREKSDFEMNLVSFLRGDEEADAILDSALGEAAALEMKVFSVEPVFHLLYSTDPATRPQLNRLLMRHYAAALKYLWPKLSVEGTPNNVDTSPIADAVSETTAKLRDLIERRAKRLAAPAAGGLKSPTGASLGAPSSLPLAAVSPTAVVNP